MPTHCTATAWVEQAAKDMGGIDIAVSNASALGGTPRGLTPSNRAAGAFVQMSTITAIENHACGEAGLSYGAMRTALISFTHQLPQDYMKFGIRCNCVCPGATLIADGSWGFL